jgi:hypothetical protein
MTRINRKRRQKSSIGGKSGFSKPVPQETAPPGGSWENHINETANAAEPDPHLKPTRTPMKKILLASSAALIATLSLATASEAGYRWHHHGHRYHGGINLIIDAGPRYVEDDYGYDGDCYVKKIRKYNRYGELVVKRVQVCD